MEIKHRHLKTQTLSSCPQRCYKASRNTHIKQHGKQTRIVQKHERYGVLLGKTSGYWV